MTLLVAENVSKTYDGFRALDAVSFAIAEDEFVSIIGPNGAGKTTLVNVLTGLLKPTSGSVRFRNRNIAGVGPVELSRRGMARAFQLVQIFSTLTVRETLCVGLAARSNKRLRTLRGVSSDKTIRSETEDVAALFNLTPHLETLASELSQGQKKLLDIASAFTLKPEIILLDEPTSGVSTADKHALMTVLLDAAKRAGIRSIILVEHDMELVRRYSKRIIAMQDGRLLADLPTSDFFANEALVSAVVGKPPMIASPHGESHALGL